MAETGDVPDREGRFRLTGEFVDRDLEAEFRGATRADDIRQLRLISVLGAVFYLGGLFIDAHLVGFGSALVPFVCVRVFFVAVALTLFGVVRRIVRPTAMDVTVLTVLILCALASAYIVARSPGGMSAHSMTMLGMVLVFYLFVPNRTLFSVLAGVFSTVVFLAVSVVYLNPMGREVGLAVLYLLLVNVLGALTTRSFHVTRRTQYLNMLGVQDANQKLRREVVVRSRAEAKAWESEERYRRLVELSPDAIVVHRKGRILYANPAALKMVDGDDEIRISRRSVMDFIDPDDAQLVQERMARMAELEEDLPPVEIRLIRLDGAKVDCEVVSGPTVFRGKKAFQSVIRDISQRKQMERELLRLATTDDLTGAHNRRRFFELSRIELARAQRYHRPICLLILDLDRFKRINDTFGHPFGDEVLRRTVYQCQAVLRQQDIVGRLGGEEFGITMPETDLEAGCAAADRLCRALEDLRLGPPDGTARFTVSIGVIEFDLGGESLEAGLKRADQALYAAKRGGRNQACCG